MKNKPIQFKISQETRKKLNEIKLENEITYDKLFKLFINIYNKKYGNTRFYTKGGVYAKKTKTNH